MIHDLKCWHEPFEAIFDGRKTYEIRGVRDRDFHVGDRLRLREWVPRVALDPTDFGFIDKGSYTGRDLTVEVTYISAAGTWGLPDDLCVLAIHLKDASMLIVDK